MVLTAPFLLLLLQPGRPDHGQWSCIRVLYQLPLLVLGFLPCFGLDVQLLLSIPLLKNIQNLSANHSNSISKPSLKHKKTHEHERTKFMYRVVRTQKYKRHSTAVLSTTGKDECLIVFGTPTTFTES